MVIFDLKPEPVRNPKECASCKKIIFSPDKMFVGHSNFKPSNNDCSSFICEACSANMQGYIIECFCGENI